MKLQLSNVLIQNFRSIKKQSFDVKPLTVFVGENDSGKSNLLRALNLFFNGETDRGKRIDFDEDCNFDHRPNRRAREITVTLTFDLPATYHETNGELLEWTKRWREEGIREDHYVGYRNRTNRLGRNVWEQLDIPTRSRVHSLLKKIQYEYVPAVKDQGYFDQLQGRLYDTIATVAEEEFRTASSSFEEAIQSHLQDLTTEIRDAIGLDTNLSLPKDLSHVFERLEFLSTENDISLNKRGDGIKARHIPLLLKFMAEQNLALLDKGGVPSTTIWGYEEPENNLEFKNAIRAAEAFVTYVMDGTAQILLTTHSPAFYHFPATEGIEEISQRSFVHQSTSETGTTVEEIGDTLDDEMGTLSVVTPLLKNVIEQVRATDRNKSEAQRIADNQQSPVYVEGTTDHLLIRKAIDVFSPENAEKISVETKGYGAGDNYVYDMLATWGERRKHHPEWPKAIGIVDNDKGEDEDELGSTAALPGNHCKLFRHTAPKNLHGVFKQPIHCPITLERFYPREIWEEADKKNWLEDRPPSKILKPSVLDEVLRGEKRIEDFIDEEWSIFVCKEVKQGKKVKLATQIADLSDAEFRMTLVNFEPIVEKIVKYLFE